MEVVGLHRQKRNPPRLGNRRRQSPRFGHAQPTLRATAEIGVLREIETLWLDRGYDSDVDADTSFGHSVSTTL